MAKERFDLEKTLFWKVLHNMVKWLMIIGSVCSTAIMVWAVIKRYFFKGNLYGSDEIIMLFAFWLYFMGSVYGSYEDSHIKADLLNVYIRNIRYKDGLSLVAQGLTVLVNTIVLVWATKYFTGEIAKWGLSTSLKIPLVIPKSSVFFGFLLMEFYHVYYLQRNIRIYLREGYYTTAVPGDYVSDRLKEKYPSITLPNKAQAKAILDEMKSKAEEGNNG
ncbi:MAG: TRAP transporter small permease [Angelakisella sp.]|nr:TRAP transporter small permease [Angelakisella sp.]